MRGGAFRRPGSTTTATATWTSTSRTTWNTIAAMLLLYVGTSLAIWFVFQMVHGLIDRVKLKEFDRQLGAAFGFLKGALLCTIITLFAIALLGDSQRQKIVDSFSGNCLARMLDHAEAVIPAELHETFSPYLEQLDARMEQGGASETSPDF